MSLCLYFYKIALQGLAATKTKYWEEKGMIETRDQNLKTNVSSRVFERKT